MFGLPSYKRAQKLKDGGRVVGPGTGTSDSIQTQVPEGSYIMPADTTEKMGLGFPGFNGKPKPAKPEGKGFGFPGFSKQVPVNLSNGEFEMTPDQVHAIGAQVLNSVKDATHAKAGPGLGFNPGMKQRLKEQKAESSPELFFADGGLVEDKYRPRGLNPQRVQDMTKQAVRTGQAAAGPAQPSPLIPDPKASGARGWPGYKTQQQAEQPGVVDGLIGGAKAVVGGLALPQAAAVDAVRIGAATLAGGDPDSLEGGRTKYRDMALGTVGSGLGQAREASEGLQESARSALGVSPAKGFVPASKRAAVPSTSSVAGAAPAAPTGSARGWPSWQRTGIGAQRQGGEIAGRVGADGVPEFTNEAATPGAVTGAAPGLGFGPTSRMAKSAGQPGVGSFDNIGNGVGTFSQGEAGDARMALDRFERANQERAQMNANRPRELGDAGGRVTVVADSSRSPSIPELMRERQAARQAQTEAVRAETSRSGALANQQIGTEQLNQQRLQQELASGQYSLQDRQRIADLQARMVDPALSEEERTSAREAYTALSTQAKDRYQSQDVILGRDESGKDIRGTQLIDVTTGRPVAGGSQAIGMPVGVTRDSAMAEARAAIASGIPRDAINQRLQQWGLEPI